MCGEEIFGEMKGKRGNTGKESLYVVPPLHKKRKDWGLSVNIKGDHYGYYHNHR
jgi:hypothetical protein